jgi:hypothetical protein
MDRRSFLRGMAGILASGFAPAFIGAKVLMPVRGLVAPSLLSLFEPDVSEETIRRLCSGNQWGKSWWAAAEAVRRARLGERIAVVSARPDRMSQLIAEVSSPIGVPDGIILVNSLEDLKIGPT